MTRPIIILLYIFSILTTYISYSQDININESNINAFVKSYFMYVTIDEMKRENVSIYNKIAVADKTFHGSRYTIKYYSEHIGISVDLFTKGAQEWNRKSDFDSYHFDKQILLSKNIEIIYSVQPHIHISNKDVLRDYNCIEIIMNDNIDTNYILSSERILYEWTYSYEATKPDYERWLNEGFDKYVIASNCTINYVYSYYNEGLLQYKSKECLTYNCYEYYFYIPEIIRFNYKGKPYNISVGINKIPAGKIKLTEVQKSLLESQCQDDLTYECFVSFVDEYSLWSEAKWFHKKNATPVLANLSPQQLMDEVYMKNPENAEKYSVVEIDSRTLKDFIDNKIMFSKIHDLPTSELNHLPDEVQKALMENSEDIEFILPDYVIFELYLDQNLIFKINTD